MAFHGIGGYEGDGGVVSITGGSLTATGQSGAAIGGGELSPKPCSSDSSRLWPGWPISGPLIAVAFNIDAAYGRGGHVTESAIVAEVDGLKRKSGGA